MRAQVALLGSSAVSIFEFPHTGSILTSYSEWCGWKNCHLERVDVESLP
jgi:hypothetical protein